MRNDQRLAAFETLRTHKTRLQGRTMRQMFEADTGRFEAFSARSGDMLLDYSKNRIDGAVMATLLDLAKACDVEMRRDSMWAGAAINSTEDRAVLHMALRYTGTDPVLVDAKDVMPSVRDTLQRMRAFTEQVRDGSLRGHTGERFTDIINIGIGGSDLGPDMVTRALAPYTREDLRLHYVSNVDGAAIADTLRGLDAKKTLVIIASKTFTTDETMTNAQSARAWLEAALGTKAVPTHFAAVSTNLEACAKFGIPAERVFGFWDWVGGRYSVWSAIGLPVALAVGYDNFAAFLAGAAEMDQHFLTAPLAENLPVIMALIGIWNRNILDFSTQAILPYDQRLGRFPAYLQQQDMESNGKHVALDGSDVDMATGPVVWGEPGTNGQHAFYQLIHQGTDVVPCDFLLAANAHETLPAHHEKLAANCLAQSEALMRGKTEAEVLDELASAGVDVAKAKKLAPHKVFAGNRPSNTLIYTKLDPATLGKLVALYEHKVFVQGTIWNVNSFDQWGVELGKVLAKALLPKVECNIDASAHDSSTQGLLAHFHKLRS